MKYLLTLLILCSYHTVLCAQGQYSIKPSNSGSMKLSGTSSLHNWSMKASSFTGNAQFVFAGDNASQMASIGSLGFSLKVSDLKSNDKKLDKNAYKSLKSDQFQYILYQLLSSTITQVKGNLFLVKAKGNLSIAGVTKMISMDVYCSVNKDESITCSSTNTIKMSDYKVKPPTFMFGKMKTGDAMTLDFRLVYDKKAGS